VQKKLNDEREAMAIAEKKCNGKIALLDAEVSKYRGRAADAKEAHGESTKANKKNTAALKGAAEELKKEKMNSMDWWQAKYNHDVGELQRKHAEELATVNTDWREKYDTLNVTYAADIKAEKDKGDEKYAKLEAKLARDVKDETDKGDGKYKRLLIKSEKESNKQRGVFQRFVAKAKKGRERLMATLDHLVGENKALQDTAAKAKVGEARLERKVSRLNEKQQATQQRMKDATKQHEKERESILKDSNELQQ